MAIHHVLIFQIVHSPQRSKKRNASRDCEALKAVKPLELNRAI